MHTRFSFFAAAALLFTGHELLAQDLPSSPKIAEAAVLGTDDSPWGRIVGGGSLYLVHPFLQNNIAYQVQSGNTSGSPHLTSSEFTWNVQPAFAIWTGYEWSNGIGMRARWFHFDGDSNTLNTSQNAATAATTSITASPSLPTLPFPSNQNTTLFSSPGLFLGRGLGTDNLTFNSSLGIDVIDLEGTFRWGWGNWTFLTGVGGRYLHLTQGYNASLNNSLGNGLATESQSSVFTHSFNGAGLTADFEANWKICGSNFSLFALGRGSLLVGRTNQEFSYTQTVNDPLKLVGGSFSNSPSTASSTDNVLPVAELEVGIDYGVNWGRAHFFARSAVISQTYFGAGNASRTDGNLTLFGAQFSLGLSY